MRKLKIEVEVASSRDATVATVITKDGQPWTTGTSKRRPGETPDQSIGEHLAVARALRALATEVTRYLPAGYDTKPPSARERRLEAALRRFADEPLAVPLGDGWGLVHAADIDDVLTQARRALDS